MRSLKTLFSVFILFSVIACQSPKEESSSETITFDIEVRKINMGGQDAFAYTLKNSKGMEVELTNYGATLSKILVPDRDGNSQDVMLTYEKVEDFINDSYFFGATAGRYANRIAKGTFELDGELYQLETNNGENHLHGGKKGFNRQFWDSEVIQGLENSIGIRMRYVSEDGEAGYPGTLQTTVDFILEKDNRLKILFEAETDKPTVVNLTHHGYFNLSNMEENILNHELKLFADSYTPVGEGLIPTGEIKSVEGTAFDFRSAKKIGEDIEETGAGYDHNFVVSQVHDGELHKMAEVYHEGTGRLMLVYSTKPGVQLYTGNFLDGKQETGGVVYSKNYGFCLEPQFFPNSPNESSFPSARLDPGEKYKHEIVYEFGLR
jgi:aldose 1-epimerase